jgi:hypothetical protein
MSPLPLLLTIPAFATRLVATTQNLLLPVARPLTLPIVGWILHGKHPFSAFVLAAIDFGPMLDFPAWTDTVFSMAGLVLLVLGVMAWLGSHSGYRRAWGRRMAFSGGGLFVVGTAFGTFVDLLQYVLG